MPPGAHSISAGRLAALDTVPCPVFYGQSLKGVTNDCLCLGDFSLHDNGLRNGAMQTAVCSHSARSVSLDIPPSPIGPSVPHMRSNSGFWAAGQAVSRLRLQGPHETSSSICCHDRAAGTDARSEIRCLPSLHCAPSVPSTPDPDDG